MPSNVLRFRLGPIPIEVHFSHVAIVGLLALTFASPSSGDGWPNPGLRAKDESTLVAVVVLWMALISVSVLFHELGHALASRAFGYQPSIHLVGMGGVTQPNANETIPWHRDLLLTVAGPLAGFLFGLAALLLHVGLRNAGTVPRGLGYALNGLWTANVYWAIFNLMPVSPLDGGKISTTVLMRLFGRVGFLLSQLVALAFGGLIILASLFLVRQPFIALFFGLYLVRAVANINGYRKGELPPKDGPRHPYELAFVQARELFKAGQLEQAKRLALELAAQPIQPELSSEVHSLLGWLALKEGQGREALDHFSLVHGVPVPPHALAAAFSLIGDDHRALPLWEMASRANPDAVAIRLEYAGTLIRVGRDADARRLPGVEMASAYSAAERVLFLRHDYAGAAAVSEKAFTEQPTAQRAYDAACCYAQAEKPDDALRLLHEATRLGFTDAERAEVDADLRPLRTLPAFNEWLKLTKR